MSANLMSVWQADVQICMSQITSEVKRIRTQLAGILSGLPSANRSHMSCPFLFPVGLWSFP